MKDLKRMTAVVVALGAALWIGGCASMAPKYERPASPAPNAWPGGPSYKNQTGIAPGKAAADIPWQEFFLDPHLHQVIALALDNNRDLRVAALNIERSRAQYQIQRAQLFPEVDAVADGSFQHVPRTLSRTGHGETSQVFDVGLGLASYELDLFGRIRSLKDQALNQYFA